MIVDTQASNILQTYIARAVFYRYGSIWVVSDINSSEVKELHSKVHIKYVLYAEKVNALVGGHIRLIQGVIHQLDKDISWECMLAAYFYNRTLINFKFS